MTNNSEIDFVEQEEKALTEEELFIALENYLDCHSEEDAQEFIKQILDDLRDYEDDPFLPFDEDPIQVN